MSISTDVRKRLVALAEKLAPAAAAGRLNKNQVNGLISVALAAGCEGEVRLYLRYQVARRIWPEVVVAGALDGLAPIMADVRQTCPDDLEAQERLVLEAWRLFGAFFKRAFAFAGLGGHQ